jgi:heptosyltransferase II
MTQTNGISSPANSTVHSWQSNAAARAAFLRITPRKWRLINAFEIFLKFVIRFLPSPRRLDEAESAPRKILVVECWHLGDLAILVPFLKNLRVAAPHSYIALLVNEPLASFLDGQGLVDEFIPVRVPWTQHFSRWKKYNPFSRLWISFARTLLDVRARKFDWVLSGRMDVRDNFLLWLSGAPRRVGYGFAGGAFLLTDCITPDLSRPHRADIWLHLLEQLGHPVNRDIGGFQLSSAEITSAQTFLREQGIPADATLIGIHPGARIATRRWGDERFAVVAKEIVENTDAHIVWFSDPGNPTEAPPLDRCHTGSLNFRSFLGVLARCQLLVCNDSGPMHLANLLQVPVVAVFGPQNPAWFGPRGAQDRVVIRPEMWCRPCSDYCIFDQPYCLRTIPPQQTTTAVNELLIVMHDGSTVAKVHKRRIAVAASERGADD